MTNRILTAKTASPQLTADEPTGLIVTASNDDGDFDGYVCAYGKPTNDYRRLEIRPGAFAHAIKDPSTVRMLWQHDEEHPIGTWLKFEERNAGLYGWGKLTAGVQKADEARLLMKSKALDGLSMGWQPTLCEPPTDKKGLVTLKGELLEVSPVTFPAFTDARIQRASMILDDGEEITAHDAAMIELAFLPFSCLVRSSKAGTVPDIRIFEQSLRDVGLASKTGAARIASLVKRDPRYAALPEARRDDEAEAKKLQQAQMLADFMAQLKS